MARAGSPDTLTDASALPAGPPGPGAGASMMVVATPDPQHLLDDWPALAHRLAAADHQREDHLALEDWLLAVHGVPAEAEPALAASALGLAGRGHGWLRIDALSLVVSRDRLVALPQQPEDAPDAAALIDALLPQLPTVGVLHAGGLQRLLDLDTPADARFAPAWRTAGRPLDSHLPEGPRGAEWRRWLTEAQMLLHEHPLNADREARGLRPLNALWLAGGAAAAPTPQSQGMSLYGRHALASTLQPVPGEGQAVTRKGAPDTPDRSRPPPGARNVTHLAVWAHRPGERPPPDLARALAKAAFELRILEPSGQQCYTRRSWHTLRIWRKPLRALGASEVRP